MIAVGTLYLFVCLSYFIGVCSTSIATNLSTALNTADIPNMLNSSYVLDIANISKIASSVSWRPKIAGGYRCPIEEYPFMVQILHRYRAYKPYCGGTLLSEFWILTAAFCCPVNYESNSLIGVAGGSYSHGGSGVQKFFIVRAYRHMLYNAITRDNDIGLMELDYPMKETKYVQFVRLVIDQPTAKSVEKDCKDALALGWGQQHPKFNSSTHDEHLQCVKVHAIAKKECQEAFELELPESVACAYAEGTDTCQGDSGGPLMCKGVQYAIILETGGIECASGPYPGLYTRVDMFKDFIRDGMLRSHGLSYLPKFGSAFTWFSMIHLCLIAVLYWK